MILVPLFDLKFLHERAATAVGTSNRRHCVIAFGNRIPALRRCAHVSTRPFGWPRIARWRRAPQGSGVEHARAKCSTMPCSSQGTSFVPPVTLTIDGPIGVITVDNPPVNAVS